MKNGQLQLRLALWLLSRASSKNGGEALIGDLVEGFHSGRSSVWLWRQVLITIGIGLSNACFARWLEVSFALIGTLLVTFYRFPMMRSRSIERMWAWGIHLGWPLSSVYDISFTALLGTAITLLLVVVFLFVKRSLTLGNILRSLSLTFPLLVLGQLAAIEFFRALPPAIGYALNALPFFLALLLSACGSNPLAARYHSSSSRVVNGGS